MSYLVGASPIGFVVLQHALPQHGHHLREGFVGEGGVGQLLHEGSCGPPGIIVGGRFRSRSCFCALAKARCTASGGGGGEGDDIESLPDANCSSTAARENEKRTSASDWNMLPFMCGRM